MRIVVMLFQGNKKSIHLTVKAALSLSKGKENKYIVLGGKEHTDLLAV